ncbi:MAG: twin-arginine translocase subunit TatC [Gammaproteobacteria bacterium]
MPETKNQEQMSIIQHLVELRNTLLHSVLAITVFFVALFPFADVIYTFIAAPIVATIPGSNLIAIGVISPFLTPLKMALILAVYLAMPFLLFKIWAFVAPALYKHEKRLILPLVISSTILFYTGILFSFYVVFPVIFSFLSTVGPSVVNFTPDIQYYLDFVIKVSFAFGVAFEVPIATILLIMFGITTPEKLKKNRAYIIIGAFVLGMILTPPDIISQVLIAIPIWLLFEAGLFFSPLFKVRKREDITEKDDDEPASFDWQDKKHKEKMDRLEDEMNKREKGE